MPSLADPNCQVRIRCAHPDCTEYDLCVLCFAKGEQSSNHKPSSHPYRVIEQNSFPIYDEEWGADEELLLLEGCESYGIGSWADIADHIGGYRTKDEVREHYEKVYLNSSKFPLPERCSPKDTSLAMATSREEFQARKKRRIEERKEAIKNAPPPPPKTKPTASVPSCHEVQGYMPGRLEFETEYANEAEEAVQLMQFEPGDGINPVTGQLEPEMELKLTVMHIYNARLTQRVERKKVIFEHNLLDYRENSKLDKKRSKDERDILNKAKPFARIMNHDDFEEFNQGLIDELNMRQAIAQLQEWRNNGIGDLRSGEKYEQEKTQRMQKSIPMGSMDRERLAVQQRGNKQQPAPEPPSGAALLVAPELPIRLAHKRPGGSLMNGDPAKLLNGDHTNGTNGINGAIVVNGVDHKPPKHTPQPITGLTPLSLTQENPPDLHLLTAEEVRLCEVCRMKPKPYLMMKAEVIREACKANGSLKKKQVKEISRLDSRKCGVIFECMVAWGYISKA